MTAPLHKGKMMQILMGLERCLAVIFFIGVLAACDFSGDSGSDAPSKNDSTSEPEATPTTNPDPDPDPVVSPKPVATFELTPFEAGELAEVPELFEIKFTQGKIPSDLTILFNGKDVTSLFEITADGATALGTTLTEYLTLKKNILTVETEGQSQSVDFTYSPNNLEIESFSDKIYIEAPPTLTINFLNEKTPTNISILLNGNDVTYLFTGNDFGVSAQGNTLDDYYVNDNNTLAVISGLETDLASFTYDMLPPRTIISGVDITSGTNIPIIGSDLIVNGLIRDVSPIKSLTINGTPATIDESNNSFTIPVKAERLMKVVATDTNDDSSTTTYLLEGQELNNTTMATTMGLTLNQSVLDFALPIVENTMRNLVLNDIDPTHRFLRFRGGACLSLKNVCEIVVTKMRVGGPGVGPSDLQVRFMPNGPIDGSALALDIVAKIPEVNIGIEMYSSGWLRARLPLAKMDMKIKNIEFSMRAAMRIHPVTNIPVIELLTSHPMHVDFKTINFVKLDVACIYFFGAASCFDASKMSRFLQTPETLALFKGLFNDDAAPALMDQVNRESFAAAEPPTGNVASTLPAPAPKVISFDTDKDGKSDRELVAQFKQKKITADDKGNAYLGLTSHFYVEEDKIPLTYPHTLGSVYVEAPEPSFGESSENGQNLDVGIALSVNMLNQFFLTFYQTGIMDTIPVPLTLEGLGDMGDLLGVIGYTEGSEFEIRMKLGSVPYLAFVNSDNRKSDSSTGIVYQMDNVRIFMYAKLPDGEEFVNILGMLMDIQANIELDILSNNYLDVPIRDDILNLKIIDILPEGSMSALVTPDLVQELMGGLVSGVIREIQEVDFEPQTTEIMLGIGPPPKPDQAFLLPLPLEIGVIMRQFEVPKQEGYLALSMDLFNEWDLPNKPAADNLTIKVDMLRRYCWAWPGDVCN